MTDLRYDKVVELERSFAGGCEKFQFMFRRVKNLILFCRANGWTDSPRKNEKYLARLLSSPFFVEKTKRLKKDITYYVYLDLSVQSLCEITSTIETRRVNRYSY